MTDARIDPSSPALRAQPWDQAIDLAMASSDFPTVARFGLEHNLARPLFTPPDPEHTRVHGARYRPTQHGYNEPLGTPPGFDPESSPPGSRHLPPQNVAAHFLDSAALSSPTAHLSMSLAQHSGASGPDPYPSRVGPMVLVRDDHPELGVEAGSVRAIVRHQPGPDRGATDPRRDER